MLQIKKRSRARLFGVAIAAVAVSASVLTVPSHAASDVLTIAATATPTSLDPMLQSVDQVNSMFINVAYDSLTRIDNKTGKIVPALATSWKYLDSSNELFELTIRKNVKFSDGSPLTPTDVAASINYASASGVNKAWLAGATATANETAGTVTVKSPVPNDSIPFSLSQRGHLGSVISSKAIATPAVLKTATYGAGPYMLDPAQTVANSTYTFVPNPNYWQPSRIKWDKIIIKVVSDANAALQAVQSGTADLFSGNQPTATAAKAAGLKVATAPFGITGVQIQDRAGTQVAALKDLRVRQAMFYAIDRASIANAVFGGFSSPLPGLLVSGFEGSKKVTDRTFQYNMSRAKTLMKLSGYPKGFSVNVSVPTANNTHLAAQAIVASWAQLGIKANLVTYTDLGQLTRDILAKKFEISVFNYGALPTFTQSKSFFNGGITQFNAFGVNDERINSDLASAAAANTERAKNDLYFRAWQRGQLDLAWITAIYLRDQVTIYSDKRISGVFINTKNPVVDLSWTVVPAN